MKKSLENITGFLSRGASRVGVASCNLWALAFVFVATLMLGGTAHAQYNGIVTYDATEGVEFAPAVLMTPIVGAVVAAVGAGATLFVISIGVRWIWRMLAKR